LTDWRGPVFDRRYEMTVVTDEDAAQIERLRYVLAQSVKEGLVERLAQWPGVHCVGPTRGKSLTGHWFDRTQEFAARLRRKDFGRMRYATVETVTFPQSPVGPTCRPSSIGLASRHWSRPSRPMPPTPGSAPEPPWWKSKPYSRAIRNTAPPFSPGRRRLAQWPGVHCVEALLAGKSLTDHWFDRTQEIAARLRRKDFGRMRYATAETVTFSPIPCLAHLSPEYYRARIAFLVESIETEAALVRDQ
jgi:hypothetical protein